MSWAAWGWNRFARCTSWIAAAGLLAGCVPTIHVQNKTNMLLRAGVKQYGGASRRLPIVEFFRLPPGGGHSVLAIEGAYYVLTQLDETWAKQIQLMTQDVEARLKDPRKLTKEEIASIWLRIGLVTQMTREPCQGNQTSCLQTNCTGYIGNSDEDVTVEITWSPRASGQLQLTCPETAKKQPK